MKEKKSFIREPEQKIWYENTIFLLALGFYLTLLPMDGIQLYLLFTQIRQWKRWEDEIQKDDIRTSKSSM
jgi:hypothetical protein